MGMTIPWILGKALSMSAAGGPVILLLMYWPFQWHGWESWCFADLVGGSLFLLLRS